MTTKWKMVRWAMYFALWRVLGLGQDPSGEADSEEVNDSERGYSEQRNYEGPVEGSGPFEEWDSSEERDPSKWW